MGWFADLLPSIVGIGGAALNVWGNERAAGQQSDAIERAAQIEAEARDRERAAYEAAAQRGIAAIRAGTGRYEETVRPMMAVDNMGLTPSQQIALRDIHRDSTAMLAASGLRGAGRAGVAAIQDTNARATAGMYDTNRARIDQARSGLANLYADEGRAVANTEIGAGSQVGSSYGAQGQSAAAGQVAMGDARAGATIGNASTIGTTLGSIGAVIADSQKRARGRYDGYRGAAV